MVREANTALLGKLVWETNHTKNKLWTQLLSNKYVKEAGFMDGNTTKGSVVWNSIAKAKSVCKDGYRVRVSDGFSSFWYDLWSSLGHLGSHVDYVNVQDINVLVRDVFKDGS